MPPRAPSSLVRLPALLSPPSTRCLQTSRSKNASLVSHGPSQGSTTSLLGSSRQRPIQPLHDDASLACLPLSQILRTYLITSVTSSPTLLSASTNVLRRLLASKTWLTDVEKNPLIRLALRETFYKQFCAGEDKPSINACMKQLQDIGFDGVFLGYALEVLHDAKGANEEKDVETWRKGLLATVDMARSGDFIALKMSGLGASAFQLLKAGENPSPCMDSAMKDVCDAAAAKSVSILSDAEEVTTTPTIDRWTLNLQRQYNKGSTAVMYSTYQAYLKGTAGVLASHLADAQREGYTLGVKLVRGAYLATDPRHMIWDTKEQTDACYDGIASALIRQKYDGPLALPPNADEKTFPGVNVVIATHNAASATKTLALRKQQAERGEPLIPLVYAQLHGMADEISCDLLREARNADPAHAPRVFKSTVWGSMRQCLNYLLRRASENKDAAGRTRESRIAMGREFMRRMRGMIGMS